MGNEYTRYFYIFINSGRLVNDITYNMKQIVDDFIPDKKWCHAKSDERRLKLHSSGNLGVPCGNPTWIFLVHSCLYLLTYDTITIIRILFQFNKYKLSKIKIKSISDVLTFIVFFSICVMST